MQITIKVNSSDVEVCYKHAHKNKMEGIQSSFNLIKRRFDAADSISSADRGNKLCIEEQKLLPQRSPLKKAWRPNASRSTIHFGGSVAPTLTAQLLLKRWNKYSLFGFNTLISRGSALNSPTFIYLRSCKRFILALYKLKLN